MAIPLRIAATLPIPPDVQASLRQAEWAEREGFDDVWFSDHGGADALTLAAAVAMRTQRVRIGLAVIPVYTRTPSVLAASAMTLSHLAPGRIILGLGASSHTIVEAWGGLRLQKPLTRVKETALIVRSLLDGGKSDFAGETVSSQGYRLAPETQGHVPVYLAGLRAKMLEMAGEFGEGVVVNLFPQEALPRMLEHVAVGAARAGKTLADREIVCRHQICVTRDKAAARELFRRTFAPYFATPVYNRFLAWCGYEPAAETILAGWREKDRGKTTAALDDAIVERIAIIGSAEECQERLRALARGGITTHIVSCFSADPAEVRETYQAFTPEHFSFSG
jgi:probable F420-dependent oxidoreductase